MDSEGVRTIAFDVVRGGYQPDAVDSALDRLEAAFLQRRRSLAGLGWGLAGGLRWSTWRPP